MCTASPFSEAPSYDPRETQVHQGVRLPAYFLEPPDEHRAARHEVVVIDRSDRGLLEVSGADRKEWLHGLLTNAVRTLEDHAGVYSFATNAKGRILFDLNALCFPQCVWLDLDTTALALAATHFDRHLFSEDVRIKDVSGQYARLACSGPQSARVAALLGVANLPALPALTSVPLPGEACLFRHDLAGDPGFELILPRGAAAEWWERVCAAGARPAGYRTLDLLRIEAGLPWFGRDLDESVLPPETSQDERAINYRKGCYLGHEIIERIRSRDALARRLVQLRVHDGSGLDLPSALQRDGRDVGRITSLVPHPIEPFWAGLGYLSTAVTGYAQISVGQPPRAITICSA